MERATILLPPSTSLSSACADQGIFARGVQVRLPERSSDNFFFCPTCFTVLQRVSNGYFKENYHFLRFKRGSNIFQGVQLFPGCGVQMLISIETHIIVIFQGAGVQTTYLPSGSSHAVPCFMSEPNVQK